MARKLEKRVFVLVVEDAPNWQKLIRELLQEAASKLDHIIEIVIASSFSEALDQISTTSFDYVTLDNELEDGKMAKTLLDRVASLEQRVPVVVISGVVDPNDVRDFFQDYRIQEFFWKNDFEPEMFRQTFTRLLVHKKKGDAETVTWLHLSDLHIGCKERSQDWKALREALLKDLGEHQEPASAQSERLAGIVFRPDLIFVTGDIAYRAGEEEYQEAENLLRSIWDITELGKEQTFVVPGNHDVDRKAVEDSVLYSLAYKQFAAQKKEKERRGWLEGIAELWEDDDFLELLKGKFSRYMRFADKCTAISTDKLYYAQPAPVSGVNVEVVGLNSALMSWKDGEDTERGLWIGQPQFNEVKNSLAEDASFRIALVHHPREALHEHDAAWTWDRVERKCQMLLHGHLHEPKMVLKHYPEHVHFCLSGGSVHEDGIWRSQHYSYGQFNLETKELDVYLRMSTSKTPEPLYVRDNQTYPEAGASGHVKFRLHPGPSVGASGHVKFRLDPEPLS